MTATKTPARTTEGPSPTLPASEPANVPNPEHAPGLRALIRQCVDETETTDPEIIVKEVLARLDPADYADHLRLLLRAAVREVWSDQRTHAFDRPTPARSSKVDAIRDVRALLNSTINLGGSEFKRLGDCGTADLLAACAVMRQLAATHARRASTYESIAGLLAQHRVKRVEDLPADVLARIGGQS